MGDSREGGGKGAGGPDDEEGGYAKAFEGGGTAT